MARRVMVCIGLVLMGLLALVPALAAEGERAGGTLIDSTGATIGQVELTQEAGGVRLVVRITDEQRIRPGNHGIHFHAVGKCDIPDFTSAAAHFNPTNKQHGAKNPQGAHAGDLPNLPLDTTTRNQSGAGYTWVTTTSAITLMAGPTSLFDADGTALVVHADPDDEMTDPTGNSGGRVACAVISQQPGLPNTGLGGMASAERGRGLAAVVGVGVLVAVVVLNGMRVRRVRG
jgi:superoxide dismutase, Cu-Zn family